MKENNNFYKISDIKNPETKRLYIEKAAQMYGYDLNDSDLYSKVKDVDIVEPKPNSQLYNQIKNSETFQKWIAENYENIKNNQLPKTSIEFSKSGKNDNAQRSLFATIHRADMLNSRINKDGSLSLLLLDGYDFSPINEKPKDLTNRMLKAANNNAYIQQELYQLNNYLLSVPIRLHKEELEEILRRNKHCR